MASRLKVMQECKRFQVTLLSKCLFLTCCLLLLSWWMTLQERVVEENIKRHPFFSVAAQQTKEKVLNFWRCPYGNPKRTRFVRDVVETFKFRNSLWCQVCIFLVEIFQLLRCVSLEWCFSGQALEDNCSKRPEI